MYHAFLSLGSNLGDRERYLQKALRALESVGGIRAISSVYETEPVGYADQPSFLNMVLELETEFDPGQLFRRLKEIEDKVGRRHREHLREREIDIDILLYEGFSYADEAIIVPHAALHRRRFVLEPFHEIGPSVKHPTLNETITSLLVKCEDASNVVRTTASLLEEHHQVS